MSRSSGLLLLGGAALLLAGCRQDMHNQPKYKPLVESEFFADHRSARPQVAGTVARGHLRIDQARYEGRVNNADIDYFPIPITRADVARGQERFEIYCAPCHGRLGDGTGMIVRRGFRQPPSYHIPRLKQAPVGHFFDVMTNGFGAMASYASRVAPDDRWRIIAYIRALQYSQDQTVTAIPADQQQYLQQHPEDHPLYQDIQVQEKVNNPATMQGVVPEIESPNPVGTTPPNRALPGAGAPAVPSGKPRQGTRQ